MDTHTQHKTYLGEKRYESADTAFERRVGNITGFALSGALILYFLVMKLFGLEDNLNFRYFNAVFYILALIFAFRFFRKRTGEKIEYFQGLKMGVRISFIGALVFSVFMGVYLSIDHEFMSYVQRSIEYGSYATPFLTAFAIFNEGFVGGMITAFVLLPAFKAK